MQDRARILIGIVIAVGSAPLIAMGCGGSSGANSASKGAGSGGASTSSGSGGVITGTAATMSTSSGSGASGTGGQAMGCTGYPGQDPANLPGAGCCTAGPSHCVATSSIPPGLDNAFVTCSGGLCVPDPIIQAGSEYVPTPCSTSIVGMKLAGVCLSECITLVSSNPDKSLLTQSTCGTGELCIPCLNPLDMTQTGACQLTQLVCGAGDGGTDGSSTSDAGPVCPYTGPPIIDPTTFPDCAPSCMGAHCIPAALVPASEATQLAACMYMGGAGYCAPDTFIASGGNGVPKTCTSIAGAEGRCLSTCLPEVASEASLLPVDVCAADERCTPCYNPTASDPTAATGACSLACDKPANAPTILTCPYTGPAIIDPSTFPMCSPACGGAHCVPASLVPAADQAQLATCTGGFCAPDSITSTAGFGVPTTCTSIAGAEGRCLSTCLPAIAGEASLLPQDICPTGEKCAPCFNPTATDPTTPTGACSLGCDKPAKPPTVLTCPWTGPAVIDPSTLPPCDNGGCTGAHCLPAAEVPAAEQSQLAPCANNTGFCAPDQIISTGNNFVPTSCDPFPGSGAPGRCLSTCLPQVSQEGAGGTIVQSSCSSGDLCVPCNDPFTGASTGACKLGCDTPPTTPFTFPKCCDDGGGVLGGTCVPAAQVPAGQQSDVNQSGNGNSSPCPTSGASYLCVPDEYLPAPYNVPPIQGCEATFADFCGVCVSQCIVNSALAFLTDSTCAGHHKCVECFAEPSTPGCGTFCP